MCECAQEAHFLGTGFSGEILWWQWHALSYKYWEVCEHQYKHKLFMEYQIIRQCTHEYNTMVCSGNSCCCQKAIKYLLFWVCVCSLSYPACNAHVYHQWPVWLTNIFPHYFIKGMIFGVKKYRTQCVLIISTTIVWNTSHCIGTECDVTKNMCWSSCRVPVTLVGF
jgi:hypothetical protein